MALTTEYNLYVSSRVIFNSWCYTQRRIGGALGLFSRDVHHILFIPPASEAKVIESNLSVCVCAGVGLWELRCAPPQHTGGAQTLHTRRVVRHVADKFVCVNPSWQNCACGNGRHCVSIEAFSFYTISVIKLSNNQYSLRSFPAQIFLSLNNLKEKWLIRESPPPSDK